MRNNGVRAATIAMLVTCCAGSAAAATCEATFQAVGDARNGQRFAAERSIPGISMRSALGQMRSMALSVGHEASGDMITAEDGTILLTQREGVTIPVVTVGQVDAAGKVFVTVKLARGQVVREEDARAGLCGQLLDRIKPGKEGEAIAEAARLASRFDVPVTTTAEALSAEVGKDAKRLSRSMTTAPLRGLIGNRNAGEGDELLMPFAAKYMGRRYVLDGKADTVQQARMGDDAVAVSYLVTQPKGLLRSRAASNYDDVSAYNVDCVLAPDQRLLAGTLRRGDFVKLAGTVQEVGVSGMRLADCRQAK